MMQNTAALIEELGQLIAHDNAVLFVGTALRKELGERSALEQITDALAERVGYSGEDRNLPVIAEEFQSRKELISALQDELHKLGDHPRPIHQLIANAVLQEPGTKVITTRFDHLLEEALTQARKHYVRIIGETTVPFFDESEIILIKMAGDIDQPDSLVLTEDDMVNFLLNLRTLNDVIRVLFLTKTLIFLGYDLNSPYFSLLFGNVSPEAAHLRRRAYVIGGTSVAAKVQRKWERKNVEILTHDMLAFMEDLVRAVKQASDRSLREKPHLPAPPAHVPNRPYKALESFGFEDQEIFRGRDIETQRLVNRILSHPYAVIVVQGESGCGKTSLLQAGVGPELHRRQSLFTMCVPQPETPLPVLMTQALREEGLSLGLTPSDASLVDLIRDWRQQLEGPIVLAIDQFEQFFLTQSPHERQETAEFLRGLLNDKSLDVRLVLSLREDFLGKLQTLEPTIPSRLNVLFRLERLGQEAAREAIEEPARLPQFGYTWQPELVNRLLKDLCLGSESEVSPPQLQIVCYRLYQKAVEQPTGGGRTISLALYESLGETKTILSDYLVQEVAQFSPDQQPLVWTLLGQLVSSSHVKQRLSLAELARATSIEPQQAAAILDHLTQQRLVQRYDAAEIDSQAEPRLEYELTHDYLVARIADQSGEGFWATQKAWEVLRRTTKEWQEWQILPAPDDLRLIAGQLEQATLSSLEAQILYAAAISYGETPGNWLALVSDTERRGILLTLLQRSDPIVRSRIVRELGTVADAEVATTLARTAVADPDRAVRLAAAQAIAAVGGQNGEAAKVAVEQVAAADAGRDSPARQALVTVRDLEPKSQEWIPARLRTGVNWRVLTARWQRRRYDILADTVRGGQGGFLGLGLGLGLVLALVPGGSGTDRSSRFFVTMFLVALFGLLGALMGGVNAFGWAAMYNLSHRRPRWRVWMVLTPLSAVFLALGLAFFVLATQPGSKPQSLVGVLVVGFLMGLGLCGAATMPLRLPVPLRLGLAVLVGMAVFAAVDLPGESAKSNVGEDIKESLRRTDESSFSVTMHVEPLAPDVGPSPEKGFAKTSTRGKAGGNNRELELSNANLRFEFGEPLEKLTFCAAKDEGKGGFSIAVNDDVRIFLSGSLSQLNEKTIGSSTVTINGTCNNAESVKVELKGTIDKFALGGQDLWIDTISPYYYKKPLQNNIEFEGRQSASFGDLPSTTWMVIGGISAFGLFLGFNRDSWHRSRRRQNNG